MKFRHPTKPMKTQIKNLLIALAVFAGIHQAAAQGTTAFTYQGQLHDNGTNANGTYTMIFKLYDSSSGGTQIGSGITNSPTLANGLFTVNLDFGAGAFNGSARYLDITVTNGGTTQTLSPRVQVLADPYAQFAAVAATVTNGAVTSAQLANNAVTNKNLTANAVNATNIASGQVVKSLNGLTDAVSLAAGANVTLATNGNTLTIGSSGGSGGSSIAAGNNVGLFTNSGIVQISSFIPNIQLFIHVTNATFTVPTNVTRIMVEMWGAGGGGGAGNTNSSGGTVGGGGGAGAYAWNVFTVTPNTSYLVTAGAAGAGGVFHGASGGNGGTSSFGALMSAAGGIGGQNGTVSGNGNGGSGGSSSGSIANVQGGSGDNNGNSGGVWRGGAAMQQSGTGGDGPGSGGSGGGPFDDITPSSGNTGNNGVVFVYY
jgi:hypothetical protein